MTIFFLHHRHRHYIDVAFSLFIYYLLFIVRGVVAKDITVLIELSTINVIISIIIEISIHYQLLHWMTDLFFNNFHT